MRLALIALLTALPLQAKAATQLRGPADVVLRDQAVLKLPKGYIFIPAESAAAVMKALGNEVGAGFLGAVLPDSRDAAWFVSLDVAAPGYVRDDAKVDADALLDQISAGMMRDNAARRAKNLPAFEGAHWTEPPHYDPATHRFVWALEARTVPAQKNDAVNYNIYALGREGYISLNLATTTGHFAEDKAVLPALVAALSFNPGKRYEDFDPKTDKIAENGLTQLVTGIPAPAPDVLAKGALLLLAFLAAVAIFKKRTA